MLFGLLVWGLPLCLDSVDCLFWIFGLAWYFIVVADLVGCCVLFILCWLFVDCVCCCAGAWFGVVSCLV